MRMEEPDRVEDAWPEAPAADRPCVVEFVTDPAVPPIPPHATWAQAKSTATALIEGDPDRTSVVKEGGKQKLQDFLPGCPG
ncbi:hypothetical protein [Streptomyces xiamenensis]